VFLKGNDDDMYLSYKEKNLREQEVEKEGLRSGKG
jgi:hypothetical protein